MSEIYQNQVGWLKGKTVTGAERYDNGMTIRFTDGSSVHVFDGKITNNMEKEDKEKALKESIAVQEQLLRDLNDMPRIEAGSTFHCPKCETPLFRVRITVQAGEEVKGINTISSIEPQVPFNSGVPESCQCVHCGESIEGQVRTGVWTPNEANKSKLEGAKQNA